MKISNNALNFLLAQYRAIFKRAYVKGIASAVLLTAGLAAGQAANAAAFSGGATSWEGASGTVTISDAQNDGVTAANRFFNNLVIEGTNGKLTITKDNGKHQNAVNVKGTLTVKSGATLTVSGGALAGAYTLSNADQTNISQNNTGDLIVEHGGTFNLNNGKWVQMDVVRFDSGSTVTLSGTAETNWDSIDMVYGQDVTVANGAEVTLTDAQLSTTQNGIMRINGEITLNSGSLLRATDNINSDGTLDDSISGKIIFGNGAKITAAKDSTAAIIGQDIQVDSGAEITVASGGELTLGGDYQAKKVGLAAAKTGSSEVVLNGTITAESGSTFKIGGTNDLATGEKMTTTLTIENGTLTNNTTATVDANIVVEDTGKLAGSGSLDLASTGGLTMSSNQLKAYVDQGGKVDAATNTGATLTFTDAVDLSSLNIFGNDKIKIGADTVVAGEGVTMSAGLQGVTGYVLTYEEDDVKLGGNDYDGATTPLSWAKVIAHNTLDLQGKNDQFLVKGTELKLDRPYYQIDENDDFVLDNCGNKIENTVGRVTGDELILSSDSASGASSGLVAKHGHWVVDNDIVVSGGLIQADTTQTSSLTAHNTPAYLELTGDLDLIDTYTNGKQYSFITAKGTGATVDVSGVGNLTLNNTTRKRIQAYQGGTIVFAGDQVEDLLGANTTNSSDAKSMLFVLNSGTLAVTDSLDLTFDQLKTDDSLKTANYIALKGNSTVDVAGTLNLTTGEAQKNTSTALSIGSTNTIKADTLILENRDETQSGSVWVKEADVAVKDGTLIALSNLTVRNDNLLLGSGGKAAIELGDSDSYIAAKPATGTVNAESITVESGSWINSYGDWTQNGKMTVNSGSFTANGSYQGTELTLGTNGKAWFKGTEDGKASSFTRVTASAANSLQVNSGTLRIEGEVVPGTGSAANTTNPYGVALADGATVVSSNATLAFGTVASDNAFTVGSNNTVTMGTGFGTINLQGGTVELNFDQSFQNGLSAASLVSLKKTWLGRHG